MGLTDTTTVHKIDKPQGFTVQPGNYIQCLVITDNGKESEKEWIYVCDFIFTYICTHIYIYVCVYIYTHISLCCILETNTTL